MQPVLVFRFVEINLSLGQKQAASFVMLLAGGISKTREETVPQQSTRNPDGRMTCKYYLPSRCHSMLMCCLRRLLETKYEEKKKAVKYIN